VVTSATRPSGDETAAEGNLVNAGIVQSALVAVLQHFLCVLKKYVLHIKRVEPAKVLHFFLRFLSHSYESQSTKEYSCSCLRPYGSVEV
jgi:hypothetical protein